jgi:chromosome segregation ATPase
VGDGRDVLDLSPGCPVCEAAAAEIKRLRGERVGYEEALHGAAGANDELRREVAALRGTACATPDPRKCVLLWEADHQRRAIEEAGLTAEEFPWGCDAIEHVAASLAGARAEVAALKLRLERDAATYATMQKGMESRAELADGLKQRARTLEAENAQLRREGVEQLQAAADEIVRLKALVADRNDLLGRMQRALRMNVTDGMDGDPVRWCANIMREVDALRERVEQLTAQLADVHSALDGRHDSRPVIVLARKRQEQVRALEAENARLRAALGEGGAAC